MPWGCWAWDQATAAGRVTLSFFPQQRAQQEAPQLPGPPTWLPNEEWLAEQGPLKTVLHASRNRHQLQPYLQHIASHH